MYGAPLRSLGVTHQRSSLIIRFQPVTSQSAAAIIRSVVRHYEYHRESPIVISSHVNQRAASFYCVELNQQRDQT